MVKCLIETPAEKGVSALQMKGSGECTPITNCTHKNWSLGLLLAHSHRNIETTQEAGEMAQRVRAQAALLKVLSSIPSNHMVAHNHL